ncbi:MAG: hypothetical protein QNJ16_18430 [Rhodobacter sp.]|nr:hypothetical protein [Rhodobacter sp.]
MTRKILTAAAILGLAAAAYAMTDIDANGDGGVSYTEMLAAHPEVSEAAFNDADTDGNGMIDEAELAAARAAGLLPDDQG